MELIDIIKNTKINLEKAILIYSSGEGADDLFEIQPKEFLRFAKLDFKENGKRGLINSLTNSKRAIDCQIDFALQTLGIKYDKIPIQSGKIIELTDLKKEDISHKLKLIHALNMAPSSLISNTRLLRNKLEHYYKKPTEKEVKEALELAELFILSLESKLKIIENEFYITDSENYNDHWNYSNSINIFFKQKENKFSIIGKNKSKNFEEKIELTSENEEYYGMIRIMNSIHDQIDSEDSFKYFLEMIGHPIPKKNINLDLR